MNWDELLERVKDIPTTRVVVELHKPIYDNSCFDLDCCDGPYPDLCDGCENDYPCKTIQAIEKELK